jgi:hypothetical protein
LNVSTDSVPVCIFIKAKWPIKPLFHTDIHDSTRPILAKTCMSLVCKHLLF